MRDLNRLQQILDYHFYDISLLQLALTHSSWSNENHSHANNERLEFLGDAVLEIHISEELFARFPNEREGALTRMRSRIVSEESLAVIASELQLGPQLEMGKGEEAQGGRERAALLSDAVEAILGAVHLDGGYAASKAVVTRLFSRKWQIVQPTPKKKDYKTMLQEYTQAHFRALPTYLPLDAAGPEHEKTFKVQAIMPDGREISASGPSLKRAEQEAARLALVHYKILQNSVS